MKNFKYIKLLSLIPVELVEAKNVTTVVILGESHSINEVISLAKKEAKLLIENQGHIFSPYNLTQLQNILNFY